MWFVELASVADPDDVADTIARAVGGVGRGRPAGGGRGRRWPVDGGCSSSTTASTSSTAWPSAIDVLTAPCPDLSVVATSREVLGRRR